jgi:hypothetical protein
MGTISPFRRDYQSVRDMRNAKVPLWDDYRPEDLLRRVGQEIIRAAPKLHCKWAIELQCKYLSVCPVCNLDIPLNEALLALFSPPEDLCSEK